MKGGAASITSVPHGSYLTILIGSLGVGAAAIVFLSMGVPGAELWWVLMSLAFLTIITAGPMWALSTLAAGSAQIAGAGYSLIAHKFARNKFLNERKVDRKQLEAGTVGTGPRGSDVRAH